MKSTGQAKYHLKKGQQMKSSIGTPFNIGLGLYIHHASHGKKLINFLSDSNISANYLRLVNIKKDIVQAVKEQKKNENGVFIPSTLERNKPIHFAIDVNLAIDSSNGKNQLHGRVVYQEIGECHTVSLFCFIER